MTHFPGAFLQSNNNQASVGQETFESAVRANSTLKGKVQGDQVQKSSLNACQGVRGVSKGGALGRV